MSFTTGQADLAFPVDEGSSQGTLAVPSGTDVMRVIDEMEITQNKVTAESLERVNSLSITELIALRYDKGTFKLPFYLKRNGVVDTAPASIDTILTNGIGVKTTNSGTNITYSLLTLATTKKNFSLFTRKGNVGVQCNGCFVTKMDMDIQAGPNEQAIFRCDAMGEFYQLRWVVPTVTTEAAATTDAGLTKIKVATTDLSPSDHATAAVVIAGKFTIGSYIKVGALTTSHKITAINPTTGVITFTPALGSDQASGSAVLPYLPTESESGDPISAHKGLVTFDSSDQPTILQMGIHIEIPRETLVNMKNNSEYPSADALNGKRRVTVDPIRAYYDTTAAPNWRALAHMLSQKSLIANVGNVDGYKYQANLPQFIIQEPHEVGSGIVEINAKGQGVASASLDDEFNFKSL